MGSCGLSIALIVLSLFLIINPATLVSAKMDGKVAPDDAPGFSGGDPSAFDHLGGGDRRGEIGGSDMSGGPAGQDMRGNMINDGGHGANSGADAEAAKKAAANAKAYR